MNYSYLVQAEKTVLEILDQMREHIKTCPNINCKAILTVSLILEIFRTKDVNVNWSDCEVGNDLNQQMRKVVNEIVEMHKKDE